VGGVSAHTDCGCSVGGNLNGVGVKLGGGVLDGVGVTTSVAEAVLAGGVALGSVVGVACGGVVAQPTITTATTITHHPANRLCSTRIRQLPLCILYPYSTYYTRKKANLP
jgi:hypothetical protein